MNRHFNAGYFFPILAVVGGATAVVAPHIKASLEQARQSEVKTNFASISTALEAYRKEYGEYSDDFKAIGYIPEGDLGYQFYLSTSAIPESVKVLLRDFELPFVSKDEYRILAVKRSENSMNVFVLSSGGKISGRDL